MPHTNFPKVPWGIFAEVDPVMMQVPTVTSAWVLPVLVDRLTWPRSFQVFLSLDVMLVAEMQEKVKPI